MTATARQQQDCSGVISAVAFGVFCVLGSLLLFYLISGPPTFLEAETMAPGDTLFHRFTWSRLWCGCLRFRNTANHSAADVALFRLPSGAARNMSLGPGPSYAVQQNVTDPYRVFEFWEAYFHPGAVAVANFSFNLPVTFYFAPRYFVDGENREADYQSHFVIKLENVTEGSIVTPRFNESGGWGFVWEKDFKNQAHTVGRVSYSFDMVEYAIPHVDAKDKLEGEGTFCWEIGDDDNDWFLAAKDSARLEVPRLQASMWCVPRYKVSIPITCIPVAVAVIFEILIIVFCIVRPRRRQRKRYVEI